ncbi:MAG: hypothetical protein EOP10_35410 [Proteobacteria bacterium]|nr:MAG: hypothetical protein EOP10_35410 [Pseudomonadota bacterium]
MKQKLRIVLFLLPLWAQTSCALLSGSEAKEFDERSFSVLNLNLFNQRTPSSMSAKSWKGDWLFRRERLDLVDEQLRISRPDIVAFQEALTRQDSPSESDMNILSAGALEGYEWDASLVQTYRDTQEMQYHAVAVGLPVKLSPSPIVYSNSIPFLSFSSICKCPKPRKKPMLGTHRCKMKSRCSSKS